MASALLLCESDPDNSASGIDMCTNPDGYGLMIMGLCAPPADCGASDI